MSELVELGPASVIAKSAVNALSVCIASSPGLAAEARSLRRRLRMVWNVSRIVTLVVTKVKVHSLVSVGASVVFERAERRALAPP